MVEYPVMPEKESLALDWEILSVFFEQNNIINVTWIDCNYTFGYLDDNTGKWTGLVGKVNVKCELRNLSYPVVLTLHLTGSFLTYFLQVEFY